MKFSTVFKTSSFISSVSKTISPLNSVYLQIDNISSTAPLVIICLFPDLSSTTTVIRRREKSKGISSTFVYIFSNSKRELSFSPSSWVFSMIDKSNRFFNPVWNQLFKKAWRNTLLFSFPCTSIWYSRTTLSKVIVPVLSVQRISIEPKFWIELRFLTIVFFLAIDTAPLARQVVTIIGNISGVSPTAIEMANSRACTQLPFVNPFTKNTIGTITIIKRISNHETELTPFSKLDSIFSSDTKVLDIEPRSVLSPVEITTPIAEPLITLLPIKAMLFNSVTASLSSSIIWAFFSTGSLSPVREDWLIKKSLHSIILKSAGIISPAAR